AQLTVTRARLGDPSGEAAFLVHGFCCCGASLPETAVPQQGKPSKLPLGPNATKQAGGQSPTLIIRHMMDWSERKAPLVKGLREVVRQHTDDLRLIVWDNSRLAIPWELFWIPPPPSAPAAPTGWLGTLATMTRWTLIHDENGPVPYRSGRCEGD